ncbi:hypothetical protein BD311DRAFT_807702 [Dichomitus squalens]|uniref:Uncharacterized protein n=1 Tax=Dichomitus squalens TaxID=114155 RepID=A0A4Q9MMS0_9APHY|nr:hypothetical protein BD311DRAFT_807702 [Dichomitus squalens]
MPSHAHVARNRKSLPPADRITSASRRRATLRDASSLDNAIGARAAYTRTQVTADDDEARSFLGAVGTSAIAAGTSATIGLGNVIQWRVIPRAVQSAGSSRLALRRVPVPVPVFHPMPFLIALFAFGPRTQPGLALLSPPHARPSVAGSESAIWTIDANTLGLSPLWVNPDGSHVRTALAYSPSAPDGLFLTGDVGAYNEAHTGAPASEVTR